MGLEDKKPGELQKTFAPADSGRERGHSAKALQLARLRERQAASDRWEAQIERAEGRSMSWTNRDYDI